jgi:hypothetical protein
MGCLESGALLFCRFSGQLDVELLLNATTSGFSTVVGFCVLSFRALGLLHNQRSDRPSVGAKG